MLTVPCALFAQTKTPERELPTFSQTADSPATAAAAVSPAASAPQPAAVAAPPPASAPQPPAVAAPPPPTVPQPPAVAAPPPVSADAPPAPAKPRKCTWDWVRDGFYLRIMSSAGYARFAGSGPAGSLSVAGLGAGSIFAIGGSLGHGLVLAGTMQAAEVTAKLSGGPYDGATITSEGAAVPVTNKALATFSQMGGLVDWYPLKTEGLHVGVSAGLGVVSLTHQADDSTSYGSSFAGALLVGYDWPIAPTWALGVALVASGSTRASLKKRDSDQGTGYTLTPFFIGLSASLLLF